MPEPVIEAVGLGRIGYAEGLRLQAAAESRRQRRLCGDQLLLLEHDPVITLGRNARREHLLESPERLAARGVELAECNRGGDITWHGPGQLVGYPIFDLRELPPPVSGTARTRPGLGAVEYVRALEEVLMGMIGELGLETRRIAGLTGVWTAEPPERKLAAIGVHISRGVTTHGFALNVAPDLAGFSAILPCGIRDREVSSLQRELRRPLEIRDLLPLAARHFSRVFRRELVWVAATEWRAATRLPEPAPLAPAAPPDFHPIAERG